MKLNTAIYDTRDISLILKVILKVFEVFIMLINFSVKNQTQNLLFVSLAVFCSKELTSQTCFQQ